MAEPRAVALLNGVPVVGYQTASLPAFFTRDSAHAVDYRLDSPLQIAQVLHAKWAMGLKGGMVIILAPSRNVTECDRFENGGVRIDHLDNRR